LRALDLGRGSVFNIRAVSTKDFDNLREVAISIAINTIIHRITLIRTCKKWRKVFIITKIIKKYGLCPGSKGTCKNNK
jgi:hypothetical protein